MSELLRPCASCGTPLTASEARDESKTCQACIDESLAVLLLGVCVCAGERRRLNNTERFCLHCFGEYDPIREAAFRARPRLDLPSLRSAPAVPAPRPRRRLARAIRP